LRALSREPRTREALASLLAGSKGRDARYDRFVDELLMELGDPADGELRARHLTQRIALAVQAAVLLGHGPDTSALAFLASRLSAGPPAAFGTLPKGLDLGALIERIFRA
jgi:putative acyl-CoA dehydrogenase